MQEYVRRRFIGMTHGECSKGLYANPKKGMRAFYERGGRELLDALRERADQVVLEAGELIREKSLECAEFLERVVAGKEGDGPKVLGSRVDAAKTLLGISGLSPVKKSEIRGAMGIVDAAFLERLKTRGPVIEVRTEEGGSRQSG